MNNTEGCFFISIGYIRIHLGGFTELSERCIASILLSHTPNMPISISMNSYNNRLRILSNANGQYSIAVEELSCFVEFKFLIIGTDLIMAV